MFDDLLSLTEEPSTGEGFIPLEKASAEAVLNAQATTADLFAELGVPSDAEIDARLQKQEAREAFQTVVVDASATDDKKKLALTRIKLPEAVQHLVGMLTEYDWEFVNQAKSIRAMIVTKLLEETKHPDARIRLKALQMLGNVTEVKLFTERVEVHKIDATEEELNARLQERLQKYLNPTVVSEIPPPASQKAQIGSENPPTAPQTTDDGS